MKKVISIMCIGIFLLGGLGSGSSFGKNPSFLHLDLLDKYDLLIITPFQFSSALQRLLDHKNSYGIKTLLETTDDIYSEYEGRDDAEQIKYCIKDMMERFDIKYVLLVGGRKQQSFNWYIPTRISNNDATGEAGYSTDLYFADIYKENGEFEDWDSNGNNIFAEWSYINLSSRRDIIDYHPDVSVGRLPCRNIYDVTYVVDKIISYETSSDTTWFNKMVCVGGDILLPSQHGDISGLAEGEVECDVASEIMENAGFVIEKHYTSDGTLTGSQDLIDSVNNGAGFVLITAHGCPGWMNVHPYESDTTIDILRLSEIKKFNNIDQLPIIVSPACRIAQFNVTIRNLIKEIKAYGIKGCFFSDPFKAFQLNWVPECLAWALVSEKKGGAIAVIANSCYGKMQHGDAPTDFLQDLNPWLDIRFFECYANQNIDFLGDVFRKSINDYINIVGGVNGGGKRFESYQRKTIEQRILFGDPSLKIGGYP